MWILKIGRFRLLLLTCLLAVLISNLLTVSISLLFTKEISQIGFILATIVPLMLGTPLSFMYIKLLFELHETKAQLEILSQTDELTNIHNRRYFIQQLNTHLKQDLEQPFALLLMDFDDFKSINDHFGHPAGDLVLQTFAQICKERIRTSDIFARLGGDEFALILPEINFADTEIFAKKLLDTFNNTEAAYQNSKLQFSISIGAVHINQKDLNTQTVLLAMDQALYQAKHAGKNQVVIHQFNP